MTKHRHQLFPGSYQVLLALLALTSLAGDGNRLTYLDDSSPFWPTPQSPKLTTPQWVGEPGVDAVVVLAIDDMRDSAKYETFLRPILDRLKRIDGRAPVSIMTNQVKPEDPQLASWLKEGLSLEVHTLDHPCPLLGKMSLERAAQTYHGCVDLLASVPGNQPVAFRMPCCDSMNSASPRFFTEIFNQPRKGPTLAIDSSVVTLPPGERFAKYFPARLFPDKLKPPVKKPLPDFAAFIEDYPFPYVIGQQCWEFPCIVPSDWEAFNVLGPNSATMLDDWKAALDRIVTQRGVFTAVFHPHGWSKAEQWVEFIDYAQQTYGPRVKFLNFREALERLEKNVLGGRSLRSSQVRLLDLNADGFMDVVIAGAAHPVTHLWQTGEQRWSEIEVPADSGQFGIVHLGGEPTLFKDEKAWTFRKGAWQAEEKRALGLPTTEQIRFRDFNKDGVCEALSNEGIFTWNDKDSRWQPADYTLPPGCAPFDKNGGDNGLRFVDLNLDGFDDVIQSNDAGYAVYLWATVVKAGLGWKHGWPHLVRQGPADPTKAKVLPFVLGGRDNGAWFHKGSIVWQNEAVATPGAESVRRTFRDIIAFDIPPERSLEDGLAALRPRPGFTAELVAAEPLIESPVAFEWDARGRLWVVEMRDYPLGMDGKGKAGGVVKILTDPDAQGRYTKATTFLEDLPFPNGLMPWRDGVLISSAPNILFARDTDGDGRADEQRILFKGFKEGNQQHRLNGFEWGLDGWVYGANGDSGGEINGVSISGRDYRFRPDTGEFEGESGQTQYGRRRDDWGNWFGNNNPNWLWHYTIADSYLRRNPRLAVKTTKQMLANYPNSTRAFPISELPIRFNQPQAAGHVTSGCSPCAYRDSLFGESFATSVFICEPVHNLVHREVLTPQGATFTSKRADDEQESEFLASTDPWFRPVMLKTGPDGALYVADFHRFALEHPEWIAPETQGRLDLRAGADKGRIYRVFPSDAVLRPVPDLASLDTPALADALDSPNGWQRDTVQRLLFERKAKEASPALRQLATQAQNPRVRVQALAALETLQELDPATITQALGDPDAPVRVQALRGSESLAADSTKWLPALLACVKDPDFTVRHQLALSLGAFRDAHALKTLEELAAHEGQDPQMRIAIMSSLQSDSALFAKLNQNALPAAPAPAVVLPRPSTPDRARVIASYAPVTSLKGAASHGQEVFNTACFICHRLKGEGMEVGPDLGMVADKPMDWLLTAFFDPNAAIEDRFKAQTLKLKSGAEITGIISAETANNVVLRLTGGVDLPVLRGDIASQKASGLSLMPEGMETVLKPQDVADLIAYLRSALPAVKP